MGPCISDVDMLCSTIACLSMDGAHSQMCGMGLGQSRLGRLRVETDELHLFIIRVLCEACTAHANWEPQNAEVRQRLDTNPSLSSTMIILRITTNLQRLLKVRLSVQYDDTPHPRRIHLPSTSCLNNSAFWAEKTL
jgi:hypothetical protein